MRTVVKSEGGFYLIFFAGSIFFLLAFVGLAIDVSSQMVDHTELQDAADACSLSAARELNGSPDEFVRAEAVGQAVASMNLTEFQKNTVSSTTPNISFSKDTDDNHFIYGSESTHLQSRFVKCIVSSTSFVNHFLGVLKFTTPILSAVSKATLLPSQNTISLPIAINQAGVGANYGYAVNEIIPFVMRNSIVFNASIDKNKNSLNIPYVNYFIPVSNSAVTGSGIPAGTVVSGNCTYSSVNGFTCPLNNFPTITKISASITISAPTKSAVWAIEKLAVDASTDMLNFGYTSGVITKKFTIIPSLSTYSVGLTTFETGWNSRFFPLTTRGYAALPVVDKLDQLIGWACTSFQTPSHITATPIVLPSLSYVGPANDLLSPCVSFGVPGGATAIGPLVPTLVE